MCMKSISDASSRGIYNACRNNSCRRSFRAFDIFRIAINEYDDCFNRFRSKKRILLKLGKIQIVVTLKIVMNE